MNPHYVVSDGRRTIRCASAQAALESAAELYSAELGGTDVTPLDYDLVKRGCVISLPANASHADLLVAAASLSHCISELLGKSVPVVTIDNDDET